MIKLAGLRQYFTPRNIMKLILPVVLSLASGCGSTIVSMVKPASDLYGTQTPAQTGRININFSEKELLGAREINLVFAIDYLARTANNVAEYSISIPALGKVRTGYASESKIEIISLTIAEVRGLGNKPLEVEATITHPGDYAVEINLNRTEIVK